MPKIGSITRSEAQTIAPRLVVSSGTVTLTVKVGEVTLYTFTFPAGDTSFSQVLDLLSVAGTLDPDATGDYKYAGVVNGRSAFERVDGTYVIEADSLLNYKLKEA